MKRLTSPTLDFIRGFAREERGVAAMIVALFTVVLLLFAGFVIDFGRVFWAQRQLQASADAAALAGGWNLPNGDAAATNAATTYSGVTGNNNATGNLSVTMAAGYPALKDFTTTGVPPNATGHNGIVVKETASVPMYFTPIMGLSTITLNATATAGARGGNGQSLNVMIILDATASMGTQDNVCGASRESCAITGANDLLQGLNPVLDYVGLMTFPGLGSAAEAADESTCGKTLPSNDVQTYDNSPTYQIVGLADTFASKTGSLTTSSPIVIATGGGGCSGGLSASPAGGVETYYAEVINAAQSALTTLSASQPHPAQNVIIFLSDGDANSTHAETDVTGYICNAACNAAGTTLTVSTCPNGCAASTTQSEGPLAAGETITGTGVTAGTTIVKQLTGTVGGAGTYQVSKSLQVGNSGRNGTVNMTAASTVTLNGTNYVQNTDQCAQAVAAAQAAAATGTWVYSVSYGSSTSKSPGSCDTDSPATSACLTMAAIASDPTKFYSDDADGCASTVAGNNIANLITLFKALSISLTEPRLLPDNTA